MARKYIAFGLTTAVIAVADQATKIWVRDNLELWMSELQEPLRQHLQTTLGNRYPDFTEQLHHRLIQGFCRAAHPTTLNNRLLQIQRQMKDTDNELSNDDINDYLTRLAPLSSLLNNYNPPQQDDDNHQPTDRPGSSSNA